MQFQRARRAHINAFTTSRTDGRIDNGDPIDRNGALETAFSAEAAARASGAVNVRFCSPSFFHRVITSAIRAFPRMR
jgi:hypothetical protein